jgi:predicted P-loop ATPase
VECRTDIDLKWLAANRDQLFAEATREYKRGRRWWCWPRRETLDKQADRLAVDPWAEAIERNWRDAAHTDSIKREFVTVAELLANVLGVQVAAQNTALHQRVAAALRVLGFESGAQCRLGGIRVRPWYAPKSVDSDDILR